jgi:hypothetical protein
MTDSRITANTNTEVPGSIPGHSLGFFWGSWVWNGVHSASWSDKLSSYLNKEVTVRFGKLKMQLWDSMCWPHVSPVPSGEVGKDCQRRLLSRPRFVRAVAPRIIKLSYFTNIITWNHHFATFTVPFCIERHDILYMPVIIRAGLRDEPAGQLPGVATYERR